MALGYKIALALFIIFVYFPVALWVVFRRHFPHEEERVARKPKKRKKSNAKK